MISFLWLESTFQAWCTDKSLCVKYTRLMPSKSGVIGLVCSMLGVPRNDKETLSVVSMAKMGVRMDRRGEVLTDFQVARSLPRVVGTTTKDCEPSRRGYLCDASFLVALLFEKKNKGMASRIFAACKDPERVPFLGKKCCLPSSPIGKIGPPADFSSLEDALSSIPYFPRNEIEVAEGGKEMRTCIEDDTDWDDEVQDQPVSFSGKEYGVRRVRYGSIFVREHVLMQKEPPDVGINILS